jgi:hypothetical protein
MFRKTNFISLISIVIFASCKNTGADPGGPIVTIAVPEAYIKMYRYTSITSDGTFVIIKSNGTPDHRSVYFPTSDTSYQNFTGPTTFGGVAFVKNLNTISSQNLMFKIPANPAVAAVHSATPIGVIGIALNGVPFYNQNEVAGQLLTNEIPSFDQNWGHPLPSGKYHYHLEPLFLTTKFSRSSLLGFLLDGFPLYGPEEAGATVTNAMLDVYHGHTRGTLEYPNGIYHYHVTSTAPYIIGNEFYGTPGIVTQ